MQSFADKMIFTLPDFMTSPSGKKGNSNRPRSLQLSKSFSKVEAVPDRATTRPSRANTIQNGAIPHLTMSDKMRENGRPRSQPDIFEKSTEVAEDNAAEAGDSGKLPADFDELPIELVSLSDR